VQRVFQQVQLFAAPLEILDEHIAFGADPRGTMGVCMSVCSTVRRSPRRAMQTVASAIAALPFTGS
jgi:hypothetical protein